MPNIEIKAVCGDFEKARAIACQLSTQHIGLDCQMDTYFKTPRGRLKLRESSLYGAILIPYIRPDQKQAKRSQYALIPVQQVELVKNLFSEIFGVDAIVVKERDIFLYENVRIHLDKVKKLGCYFELEAVYELDTEETRKEEQRKVNFLLDKFGFSTSDLLKGSYREMIKDYSSKSSKKD